MRRVDETTRKRIIGLREQQGLTNRTIAKRMGVSVSTVKRITRKNSNDRTTDRN